jgi:hypothetical protein
VDRAAICRSPAKRSVNIVHAGINKRPLGIVDVTLNKRSANIVDAGFNNFLLYAVYAGVNHGLPIGLSYTRSKRGGLVACASYASFAAIRSSAS